jgi:hypothetical protein
MGILPALRQAGYVMLALRLLGGHGRTVASLDLSAVRSLLNDRYINIARGDLASTVYRSCQDVQTRCICLARPGQPGPFPAAVVAQVQYAPARQ